MRKRLVLSLFVLAFMITALPVHAATENDAREVMGLERMEGNTAASQAAAIIASCAQDVSYNDLVEELDKYGLSAYEDVVKRSIEGKKSYDMLIEDFTSGTSVEKLYESFRAYDSYYQTSLKTPGIDDRTVELEKISEEDIGQRLLYAEAIMATAESDIDIGAVGNKLKPITGKALHISDISEQGITLQTEKRQLVCSQFAGEVMFCTEDTIVIKSGATIYITYEGVTPLNALRAGDELEQYECIGYVTSSQITIRMVLDTQNASLLLLYGNHGQNWYQAYMEEYPWKKDVLDVSAMKNKPDAKEKETPAITYEEINKKGKKTEHFIGKTTESIVFSEDPGFIE